MARQPEVSPDLSKFFPPDQHEPLRRMAAAENYNEWLLGRCEGYLGKRVLDAGAGIGTFSAAVAVMAELVVAVEPDPSFIPLLRQRFASSPNVSVVHAGAGSLSPSVPTDSFDSAICFNVLEHIDDPHTALVDIRTHLRPGGFLLLVVPAHPRLFGSVDVNVGHKRRYSRHGLREELEQAGFAVETLRFVNPVGAIGWFVSGRIVKRDQVPEGPLRTFDRLVPLLRPLDRVDLGFGLSLWAVARRP